MFSWVAKIPQAYKAVVAGLGAIAGAVTVAVADDVIDLDEWATIGGVAGTAALSVWAVFQVRNRPPGGDGPQDG